MRINKGDVIKKILLILLIALLVGNYSSFTYAQSEDPPEEYRGEGLSAQEINSSAVIQEASFGIATADPDGPHSTYDWPFTFEQMGHAIQSYQNYSSGTSAAYFHHGIDMIAPNGTAVYTRSGGQVVNVENYQPGNSLYWEVAILDPEGYVWQYHHIDRNTIPNTILNKYAEWQSDPINGGFVDPDTHIGNIVYWTVESFGYRFNHIHLNILAAGDIYLNPMEFHTPIEDTQEPEILEIGLLDGDTILSGDLITGEYGLYVRARDLYKSTVYYLPPYKTEFSIDGGEWVTVWEFHDFPGGFDDEAYVNDFFVPVYTCGNYTCRDFYIDLGFSTQGQRDFPSDPGEHTIDVKVWDFNGNSASSSFTWTVYDTYPVFSDDFESDLGWMVNPYGTDTETLGLWERANPELVTYNTYTTQLGTTVSGDYDLVTGRLAGSDPGSFDVDDGVTSICSPNIELPEDDELLLSFYYYLAQLNNATAADYFRVSVIGDVREIVFEKRGIANTNINAVWQHVHVDISDFAGQTVYILIEAADEDTPSLIEAAVDDVAIQGISTDLKPKAIGQRVTTAKNTPVDIILTGSDRYNDPLSFTVTTNPMHGTLSGSDAERVYTPDDDFVGLDQFTFSVSNNREISEPAIVSIYVYDPTSVDLISFSGIYVNFSNELTWETDNGIDIRGFNLYRAFSEEGERIKINAELIPSKQVIGIRSGATYKYTDSDIINGQTYYYWLECVDYSDSVKNDFYGPIEIRNGFNGYLPLILY